VARMNGDTLGGLGAKFVYRDSKGGIQEESRRSRFPLSPVAGIVRRG